MMYDYLIILFGDSTAVNQHNDRISRTFRLSIFVCGFYVKFGFVLSIAKVDRYIFRVCTIFNVILLIQHEISVNFCLNYEKAEKNVQQNVEVEEKKCIRKETNA